MTEFRQRFDEEGKRAQDAERLKKLLVRYAEDGKTWVDPYDRQEHDRLVAALSPEKADGARIEAFVSRQDFAESRESKRERLYRDYQDGICDRETEKLMKELGMQKTDSELQRLALGGLDSLLEDGKPRSSSWRMYDFVRSAELASRPLEEFGRELTDEEIQEFLNDEPSAKLFRDFADCVRVFGIPRETALAAIKKEIAFYREHDDYEQDLRSAVEEWIPAAAKLPGGEFLRGFSLKDLGPAPLTDEQIDQLLNDAPSAELLSNFVRRMHRLGIAPERSRAAVEKLLRFLQSNGGYEKDFEEAINDWIPAASRLPGGEFLKDVSLKP